MYDELKNRQRRDMWKAIPSKRLKEIRREINEMQKGRDRTVLHLAFIDGLTTTEIAEIAKNRDDLMSRNHRPLSRRRIQQIILIYVPDANAYQDHSFFATHHKKEYCANCGSTERLEWHHMIPAALGGTAEAENMICLCHECHQCVSRYHRKLLPEIFNGGRPKTK